MNLNTVMVAGRLTRDPELKALPSGNSVCSLSIASNRVYNDRDGIRQEDTEFHNVVAFGKTAETIAKYKKKGDLLFVTGRLQTRSWDKDGQKQYRTEIVVDKAQFISGVPSAKSTERDEKGPVSAPEYPDEEIRPEDIPF